MTDRIVKAALLLAYILNPRVLLSILPNSRRTPDPAEWGGAEMPDTRCA